jgi:hypothetical protein
MCIGVYLWVRVSGGVGSIPTLTHTYYYTHTPRTYTPHTFQSTIRRPEVHTNIHIHPDRLRGNTSPRCIRGLVVMDEDLKDASKSPVTREELLEAGTQALDQAMRYVGSRYTKQSDRQSWARITANLIASMGGVLRDVDLDELKARVAALEEAKTK